MSSPANLGRAVEQAFASLYPGAGRPANAARMSADADLLCDVVRYHLVHLAFSGGFVADRIVHIARHIAVTDAEILKRCAAISSRITEENRKHRESIRNGRRARTRK